MRTSDERAADLAELELPGALDATDSALAKRKAIQYPWRYRALRWVLWRLPVFVRRMLRRRTYKPSEIVRTKSFGDMTASQCNSMMDFARATGDRKMLSGLRVVG